jgi:hypothetical protein
VTPRAERETKKIELLAAIGAKKSNGGQKTAVAIWESVRRSDRASALAGFFYSGLSSALLFRGSLFGFRGHAF